MVNKSSKGLVGALAVALATSGAPVMAENADKIGNNQKCEYGHKAVSGFFNGMAHGFAVSDLTDLKSLKVADGGTLRYSPSAGICEYKGTPYGTPVGLVGVVTENGMPVAQYTKEGLKVVEANKALAYLVGGAIIVVGVAAVAAAAHAAGSSSGGAAAGGAAACTGAGWSWNGTACVFGGAGGGI